MFGRRANRRRVESRLARLKLPTLGAVWMRRMRAALVLPLVALTFYGAFKGVQLALDQPVRYVEVEGTFQRVTPIQVEAAVAEGLNAGFMTVSLSALRERVEQLDWVDRANVGRRWPDTVIVRVTEHKAAARWGQVVVLKGARTVVAEPEGELYRAEVATPALATAGSGDVLSGVIGAFLAGGASPLAAATCGVAVHGAAGLIAADRIGSAGVMARDLANLLPEAIAELRGERAG